MIYQKNTGKLQHRWRGPFIVDRLNIHCISYFLRQFSGRKIKGTCHGNHLKQFVPRSVYLDSAEDWVTPNTDQNVRHIRMKKGELKRHVEKPEKKGGSGKAGGGKGAEKGVEPCFRETFFFLYIFSLSVAHSSCWDAIFSVCCE